MPVLLSLAPLSVVLVTLRHSAGAALGPGGLRGISIEAGLRETEAREYGVPPEAGKGRSSQESHSRCGTSRTFWSWAVRSPRCVVICYSNMPGLEGQAA